jgi:plasmid stability protein
VQHAWDGALVIAALARAGAEQPRYYSKAKEVVMADIVIDLDDSLVERLKVIAELKGRSLEDEIREIINRAAPLTPEERVALSDRIRAMQAKPSDLLSEDLIREDRDSR